MYKEEKNKALLLRKQGMSIRKIANKLGIARSTISLWMKELPENDEIKRKNLEARKDTLTLCPSCGTKINKRFTLCRKCYILNSKKDFILKNGRICITAPKDYKGKLYDNRYVLRYRYVMEQYLGRLLKENEVVHHKDGNKTNDTIENLEIMLRKNHTSVHAKTGRTFIVLYCSYCKIKFKVEKKKVNYKKNKGQKFFFCSRSCSGKFFSEPNNLKKVY